MRIVLLIMVLLSAAPAFALSRHAEEFMRITKELEPVHCEKQKLRRAIALAEAERRRSDAEAARERFAQLDRDPKVAKLEKRLAELEPFVSRSPDPEDLRSINQQRVEAFYRCE